jgi:hypothetical protein
MKSRSEMALGNTPLSGPAVNAQKYLHVHRTSPPSYQDCTRNSNSLDITQRIERKLAQYNASQNVFKRWLFEILSVTTSACCIGKGNEFPNCIDFALIE